MTLPLAAVFADLPDPRRETANKLHALTDILVLATCGVIGGCDTWDVIAEYAQTKADFFRRFLPLANGIPSADTFGQVFAKLNPARRAEAFGRWMAAACEGSGLVPIAIDGKAARSAPASTAAGCLTVVSAWATENRLTLGQAVVPDGANAIAVIPELLQVLELKGAIVTLDAAGGADRYSTGLVAHSIHRPAPSRNGPSAASAARFPLVPRPMGTGQQTTRVARGLDAERSAASRPDVFIPDTQTHHALWDPVRP